MSTTKSARKMASAWVYPLVKRAARAYIAGDSLHDALRLSRKLALDGTPSTIGFWDGPSDSPRDVAEIYATTIDALAGSHNYVSIKLPALRYSSELLSMVAETAQARRVRLHFDAMDPASAGPTRAAIERLLSVGPAGQISFTLPARWRRSLEDAAWAVEHGLTVRVVKGQWINPIDPDHDPSAGYMDIIGALAGRARHVAVATHDTSLAMRAIETLKSAGTSCELELLHGLPMREPLRLARRLKTPTRVYVPFGQAYLPYALSKAAGNPRTLWWLVRDLFVASREQVVG